MSDPLFEVDESGEDVTRADEATASMTELSPAEKAATREGHLGLAEGPPESISQNQAVVDAYLGAHHDAPLTVEEEDRVLAEAGRAIADEESAPDDVLTSDTSRQKGTDR